MNEVVPDGVAAVVVIVSVEVTGQLLYQVQDTGFGLNDVVAPVGNVELTLKVVLLILLNGPFVSVTMNVADPAVPAVTVPVCEPTVILS